MTKAFKFFTSWWKFYLCAIWTKINKITQNAHQVSFIFHPLISNISLLCIGFRNKKSTTIIELEFARNFSQFMHPLIFITLKFTLKPGSVLNYQRTKINISHTYETWYSAASIVETFFISTRNRCLGTTTLRLGLTYWTTAAGGRQIYWVLCQIKYTLQNSVG